MADPFPHGENRGYRRHLKDGTPACDPRLAANRRERNARDRAREAAGKPTPWAATRNAQAADA